MVVVYGIELPTWLTAMHQLLVPPPLTSKLHVWEPSAESAMNHIYRCKAWKSTCQATDSRTLGMIWNDNIYIKYICIWIFDLKISQDFQRWYFCLCIFRHEEFQDCAHLCPPLHRAKASLPKPPKARKARTRQQLPICVIVPRVG